MKFIQNIDTHLMKSLSSVLESILDSDIDIEIPQIKDWNWFKNNMSLPLTLHKRSLGNRFLYKDTTIMKLWGDAPKVIGSQFKATKSQAVAAAKDKCVICINQPKLFSYQRAGVTDVYVIYGDDSMYFGEINIQDDNDKRKSVAYVSKPGPGTTLEVRKAQLEQTTAGSCKYFVLPGPYFDMLKAIIFSKQS
jgi:hypothetical protein